MLKTTDMIYDGKQISSYLVVEEIERPLTPTIKNNTIKLPGRIGVLYGNQELGEKQVSVRLRIIEDSRQDVYEIADKLKSDLSLSKSKELHKLQLRDNPGRYEMVTLSVQPNFDVFFNKGEIILDFINPYGVSFSDNEKVMNLSGTATHLTNEGTSETYITLKAMSNGSNPATITNGEDTITLEGLASGQVVTIEFEEEAVKVDGTLKMGTLWLASDFWSLSPGQEEISVTNLTLQEARYRERWL